MSPIVSPWLIYAIYEVGKAQSWAENITVGSAIVGCVALFMLSISASYDKEERRNCLIIAKYSGIALASFGLLAVILPDQKTLMQMAIASYITPENISYVGDTVNTIADSLVEKIKAIK